MLDSEINYDSYEKYSVGDMTRGMYKYQRMRETNNITGFVVNIHDATNFDVDLDMSEELHKKYQDVISNQYTYMDLDDNFLNIKSNNINQIGKTYRCRLRGVGVNQLSANNYHWKMNQIYMEIKQLIDRTDGWIICTLSDIDIYHRLLVDIVIHTSNGSIDLRKYLLSCVTGIKYPIFYTYSGKRHIYTHIDSATHSHSKYSNNIKNTINSNNNNNNSNNINKTYTHETSTNETDTNKIETETATNETTTNETTINETATNETATNETGTNETATNETGTNETATNETGTNETGTNETGTNETEIATDETEIETDMDEIDNNIGILNINCEINNNIIRNIKYKYNQLHRDNWRSKITD